MEFTDCFLPVNIDRILKWHIFNCNVYNYLNKNISNDNYNYTWASMLFLHLKAIYKDKEAIFFSFVCRMRKLVHFRHKHWTMIADYNITVMDILCLLFNIDMILIRLFKKIRTNKWLYPKQIFAIKIGYDL